MFNKLYNFFHKKELKRSDMYIFTTMLIGGVLGLLTSFNLVLEELHLLQNPDAVLNCSVNIVLNCATVMQTWQASLLGFPNSLIGLMFFPVVITLATAGLIGVKFPKVFMAAATIGFTVSAAISYWMFFESVYVIQVLCPWCLLLTFSETLILGAIIYYALRENIFNLSSKLDNKIQTFLKKGYFLPIVISWIVILIALVFLKFGDALFA